MTQRESETKRDQEVANLLVSLLPVGSSSRTDSALSAFAYFVTNPSNAWNNI